MLRQSIEKNVQLGLVWSSKDQNKSVSSSVPKDKRAISTPGQWISQHPYSCDILEDMILALVEVYTERRRMLGKLIKLDYIKL